MRKYFGNVYSPVVWTLIIGILLAMPGSMLPNETHFAIPQFDKIVHISLFGGFVFLWNLYLSVRPIPRVRLLRLFFLVFILAEAYGIGMEYVQKYFIPLRDFDEADIIADIIGAGLAYGLSNILLLKD
ncbi:MAG TPA: VanZ family protein [Puia sp.]|nr:VanZ family protein [Puia sp.]